MERNIDYLHGYYDLYDRIMKNGLRKKQKEFERIIDQLQKIINKDFNYCQYNGINRLVLKLECTKKKGFFYTEKCPYCGNKHRIADIDQKVIISKCHEGDYELILDKIHALDGTELNRKNGCIIEIDGNK